MATATVQTPDGKTITVQVPDGATEQQIMEFVQANYKPEQAAQMSNEDVPTAENLAIPRPSKQERTLGENLIGAGEAALTAVTGATGGALGYLASAPDAALNEMRGKEGGFDNANAMAAENTYSPRTDAGKEFVKSISETLGVLPPVLGSGGMPAALNASAYAGRIISVVILSLAVFAMSIKD